MAKPHPKADANPSAADDLLPSKLVARACRLFEGLRDAGVERDRAGNRDFRYSHFAALHLLALFHPTLQSLRGLQEASHLRRIQALLGAAPVSLGSLSESPAVFDPDLIVPILEQVLAGWSAKNPGPGPQRSLGGIPDKLARQLVVADGTLLRVLPQLVAAGTKQARWRMHLQFRPLPGRFDAARLTADPTTDERDVLARRLEAGCVYVADRGDERYALFNAIVAHGSDYVIRVQDRPFRVVEDRPLSAADRAARVVSDQIIALGVAGRPAKGATPAHPIRRIVIAARGPGRRRTDQPETGTILVLTSLAEPPAAVIAAIYEARWSIELFFRFLKQVLGLKRMMSAQPNAIAIQTYVALIACVLLTEALGVRITATDWRLFVLYLQGWVEDDELQAHLNRRRAKEAPS